MEFFMLQMALAIKKTVGTGNGLRGSAYRANKKLHISPEKNREFIVNTQWYMDNPAILKKIYANWNSNFHPFDH